MTEANLAGVVVLIGRGPAGRELLIGRRPIVLGRDPWVDVVVRHPAISRHHVMLWAEPGQLFVRDLGASGGTWVGGGMLSAGESRAVGKRQTLGLGGALDLRWRKPREAKTALPDTGRLVLELGPEGWRVLAAATAGDHTSLSDTKPGLLDDSAISLAPSSIQPASDIELEIEAALANLGDYDDQTEEDLREALSTAGQSDEIPTARLPAVSDLLILQSDDDITGTATATEVPAIGDEDSIMTGPPAAAWTIRLSFDGGRAMLEEPVSGNATRVRGETRVELLRILAMRLAAWRRGQASGPHIADRDLAALLWPEDRADAGPRVELLLRRLHRQIREAGLPEDVIARGDAGTRLSDACGVPELTAI